MVIVSKARLVACIPLDQLCPTQTAYWAKITSLS